MSDATTSPTITPAAMQLGAATIEHFEGFRSKPYWDANGRCYSIGFGMCELPDGATVNAHTAPITEAEAVQMLATKLAAEYAPGVQQSCEGASLTDSAWAGLLSFAWNLGDTRLDSSGIGDLVAEGDLAGAGRKMREYDEAGGKVLPGLVIRRRAEAQMVLGDAPAAAAPVPPVSPAAIALSFRTTATLNVRTGPGAGYAATRFSPLAAGAAVAVIVQDAGSGWSQVRQPDGSTGWVNSSYLAAA